MMSRRRFFQMFVTAVVTACIVFLTGVLSAQGNSEAAFERVKEVQERHTDALMAKPGVVGTAVGLNGNGRHAVLVLLENPGVGGIPQELEGVPVRPLVTGAIYALPKPPGTPGGGKGRPNQPTIDPTARFERPVPIGVSTGNANETSAGTIACRVRDGDGNVYALSNNHVYARENSAGADEEVLQPGRYDGGIPGTDYLGTLYAWVNIDFSESADNVVDAAIAVSTTDLLGTSTPADGYGTPTSGTTPAEVGVAVQKYGRTTSLTKGTITGVNAIVKVGYSGGVARFIDQIIVESRKPFIKAGDSGSLLVTDSDNSPVGLLFAGDNSGKFAVANDIDTVLDSFEVSISIDGL